MFLTRSEYDRGVSTFSPEGRLFQVEYSSEAIKLGSTAIGIATSEGIVLGVEKRITSSLLVSNSIEKIMEIDSHIGCAMSGLTADARSMVEHARVSSVSHDLYFDEPIAVEALTQSVCDLALRFGEGASGEEERLMSRPFGVALLIGGFDKFKGYQLYHAEPSGTFYQFKAKAIGSGSEGAQSELQSLYRNDLTLEEAQKIVLKTLKQVMEEKLDATNAQICTITKETGYKVFSEDETKDIVDVIYKEDEEEEKRRQEEEAAEEDDEDEDEDEDDVNMN
ncbi:proteasome component pup2 [Hanseniaspora opuntiae]